MSKTIIYIPLDERPCNLAYPIRLFSYTDQINVLTPPTRLLGRKKCAADVEGIREFILEHVQKADAIVFSTEMVVYGGLLPSRIYDLSQRRPDIVSYQTFVHRLKTVNSKLLIYASNLIMRTPRYSSSDEEPEYYQNYGKQIFRHGWLTDKKLREGLSNEEQEELEKLKLEIPAQDITDYETRRAVNLKINLANIDLVKQGAIDYLVIPQDDSAPYGYTARDQSQVYPKIKRERLQHLISVYPGADEAGYTLLARAVQKIKHHQIKVYPFFASTIGSETVPLYEDRPMIVTVQSHLLAAGTQLAETPEMADLVLAVNTPGKKMIEARDQLSNSELTYETCRNLRMFVSRIAAFLKAGKPVAVADSAYANGDDLELIEMLDSQELLLKLAAYRGWNTDANTVGSALATAVILKDCQQSDRSQEVLKSLYDDGFYQAIVRGKMTHYLPELGLNYFDLKDQSSDVAAKVEASLDQLGKQYLANSMKSVSYSKVKVVFPWNRLFEINLTLSRLEVSE